MAPQTPGLTTDVEQVREEEGLFVEVLDGEDDGAVEAAPQRLLGAALVCDEGFQHGPHHVQLEKERRHVRGWPCIGGRLLCAPFICIFFCSVCLLKALS